MTDEIKFQRKTFDYWNCYSYIIIKNRPVLLNLQMASEKSIEGFLMQPSIPYYLIKLDEGQFPTADSWKSIIVHPPLFFPVVFFPVYDPSTLFTSPSFFVTTMINENK